MTSGPPPVDDLLRPGAPDVVNGLTATECKTARAALGWTQGHLHERSGVGITSIKRFEAGATIHAVLLAELRRTLEAAGVVFLEAGGSHCGRPVKVGVIVTDP